MPIDTQQQGVGDVPRRLREQREREHPPRHHNRTPLSLHRVDAVMYAQAGPLLLLPWAWIGAAAIVIAAAWAASLEQSRSPAGTRARAAGGDG